MSSKILFGIVNVRVISTLFFLALFGTFAVNAQPVKLRSNINPPCSLRSNGDPNAKFADIYADGNIAVMGSYDCRGAFIFDISDPDHPVLANHYNPGQNQQFLEAIVIGDRGYFGSGNGGGVHIVDLSVPSNPVLLGIVNSSSGNGFNSIHEMVVFEQNGAKILVENFNGTSGSNAKLLKFINVSNPANPVFIRNLTHGDPIWVHAMHIRGDRMFTSGWGSGSSNKAKTEIWNIANITSVAPQLLGTITEPTATSAGNSMHSSWTSEDGNYLYSAREIGSSEVSSPGDVRVYNISDPSVPLLIRKISMADLGIIASTPHNPVVMGDKLYVSWYQAGLQIFDLKNPSSPLKIGEYDTWPMDFSEEDRAEISTADRDDIICGVNLRINKRISGYDGNWAVYPFLGEDKILVGDLATGLYILDNSEKSGPAGNNVSDFDGDGKTDFSYFNPTNGVWTIENSSNGSTINQQFGLAGDIITPSDFDGDGRTDIAVYRPSNGVWYIYGSTVGFYASQFGLSGDVPVAGDYDGDGKSDIAIYRPSNGVWYILQSSLGFTSYQFGLSGDKAMAEDFDGDGKVDSVIWRPSTGIWYILPSTNAAPIIAQFGLSGDIPVNGDYNGDGKSDFMIYRPSTGVWYILESGSNNFTALAFGLEGDLPIAADYDGDAKTDIALYRASQRTWYRILSADNTISVRQYGIDGNVPSPSSVHSH